MNRVLFSSKYSMKNIVLKYICLLLPFLVYGMYKNGLLLYNKNIISFMEIFKIIYLILISLGVNLIFKIILKKKLSWNIDILNTIIVPMFMPYNIGYIYYLIGYIIGNILVLIINKYININKAGIIILTIYAILYFTQGLNFLNPLENSGIYNFNTIDLLFGRTYGGIAATCIIYAIIFVLVSSIINHYKYIIPIISIATYFLITYFIVGFSYKTYTNSFIIIGIILLTMDSRSNPISMSGKIIYSLLLGVLISLFSIYLKNPIWLFICQIIVNLGFQIVAKISKKCYNMNDFLSKKMLENTRGA